MIVASLIVGCASLAVGLAVLSLTVLNYRRDRERADVDMEVHALREEGRGTFAVRNTGRDPAHRVRVEMWDGHDYVTEERGKLAGDDVLVVVLPHRQERGPDEVDLPPSILPPPAPGDSFARALRESTAATEAMMRERGESEQVHVRIVWRTRRGTWKVHEEQTG